MRQWSWLDVDCQRFRMVYAGDGEVVLTNHNSGLAVTSTDDGVVQEEIGGEGQHFSLEPMA